MNYAIAHHSTMLSDSHRLEAFKKAIEELVKKDSTVVDIGTGTGILASYAATLTEKEVVGVEYFPATANIATALAKSAGLDNLRIYRGSSFDLKLEQDPDVLISETIGPIGPEENIVELFWDFCRRHPSIQKKIPARLEVLAVPCFSPELERLYDQMKGQHQSASHGRFNYAAVERSLEEAFSTQYYQPDSKGTILTGNEVTLADYNLGVDFRSDFLKEIDLTDSIGNAIHLFFRAKLSDSTQLSSHLSAPNTHWRHSFVRVPSGAQHVKISYSSKTNNFHFDWRTA